MKVLVADDETLSLKTLCFYMEKLGYEVFKASDGEEALRCWRNEKPHIVLTDWNMPKMNGVDLCLNIRREEIDYTYIIFISSRERTSDLLEGFDAGADDYLTKPIIRDELYARIRAAERIFSLRDKDMMINALAKLAEARDQDTGFHLKRVQEYSKVICEALLNKPHLYPEINRHFIETVYSTSPLHDIGKVGIPDRILLKPGKLSPEEFDIMQNHTLIGFDAINNAYEKNPHASYLRISAEIARSHHERWDGTGYPDGLSGKNIPLSARIVAVADVFDALTSKRVYKEAFRHEISKQIMIEGRGTQFDPNIIDAFLEVEDDIHKISRLYRDE